jgi:hypothetical protein
MLTKAERRDLEQQCDFAEQVDLYITIPPSVARALLDALDVMGEALEPFAEKGRRIDRACPDSVRIQVRFSAGDLRRAAEAKGE